MEMWEISFAVAIAAILILGVVFAVKCPRKPPSFPIDRPSVCGGERRACYCRSGIFPEDVIDDLTRTSKGHDSDGGCLSEARTIACLIRDCVPEGKNCKDSCSGHTITRETIYVLDGKPIKNTHTWIIRDCRKIRGISTLEFGPSAEDRERL